jgi:hypothetical protein
VWARHVHPIDQDEGTPLCVPRLASISEYGIASLSEVNTANPTPIQVFCAETFQRGQLYQQAVATSRLRPSLGSMSFTLSFTLAYSSPRSTTQLMV